MLFLRVLSYNISLNLTKKNRIKFEPKRDIKKRWAKRKFHFL